MPKFRSWIVDKFYYWQNGEYYSDINCKIKNKYLDLQESGFWQNKEQAVVIDGKEFFENDFIKYQINNVNDKIWSEPAIVINTGYAFVTRVEPYDKETPFNQCIMYPKRFTGCEIIKLGDIHEGVINE